MKELVRLAQTVLAPDTSDALADTHEKPHVCKCGKSFSRRSLSREERSVTSGLTNVRDLLSRHIKTIESPADHQELQAAPETVAEDAAGTENATTRTARDGDRTRRFDTTAVSPSTTLSTQETYHSLIECQNTPEFFLSGDPSFLDLLWDDLDFHPDTLDYAFVSAGFQTLGQFGISDPLSEPLLVPSGMTETQPNPNTPLWGNEVARPASRVLSTGPDFADSIPKQLHVDGSTTTDAPSTARVSRSSWHITRTQYEQIRSRVKAEDHVLGRGFQFPSKHAFSRYIEGYSGFHSHLPFLHFPTKAIHEMSVELVLAIAGMGAQQRFERDTAMQLGHASKRIIDARLRLYDSSATACAMPKPSTHDQSSLFGDIPSTASSSTGSLTISAMSARHQQRPLAIETIQSMLIVMSLYTWNHESFLPAAFSLADQIAQHLRQGRYLEESKPVPDETWSQWVHREERCRTVLIAFALLNLHTVIYDVPPRFMHREVWSFRVPQPESQWAAATAQEWLAIRKHETPIEATVGECYHDLFNTDASTSSSHGTSAFGNLVTIHGILQQIFLARESCISFEPDGAGGVDNVSSALPAGLETKVKSALCRWQQAWSSTKESSVPPITSARPLGFNSTALFRVACVRASYNLGPCRKLETRDPIEIANAFKDAPHPIRSPRLYDAILQSAHALSIPVRVGVKYFASTQTLMWSIVHGFCNLECALFLSKWLERLSLEGSPLVEEEQRLLCIVAGVLRETPFFESTIADTCSDYSIKLMSYAVIRLVAESFRSVHLFELMDSFERAVDLYAAHLQSKLDSRGL